MYKNSAPCHAPALSRRPSPGRRDSAHCRDGHMVASIVAGREPGGPASHSRQCCGRASRLPPGCDAPRCWSRRSGAGAAACRGAGDFLRELLRERPPAPLDSLPLASDARVDSAGYLAGSFVGEGTSRAVHLLSSDTAFIASLVRRFRPDLAAAPDPWAALARERVRAARSPGRPAHGGRARGRGSSRRSSARRWGTRPCEVEAVLLHGGGAAAAARGAQAELIVADDRLGRRPAAAGPGARLAPDRRGRANRREPGLVRRDSVPAPSAGLTGELVGRTERALDSHARRRLPRARAQRRSARTRSRSTRWPTSTRPTSSPSGSRPTGCATPSRFAPGASPRAATRWCGTAVMVWDSAGAWRQGIFRPTLLRLRGGRLEPWGARGRPIYWRRLQPISDFAFRARRSLDGAGGRRATAACAGASLQPRENVVVAAAEVDGPCR